MATAPLSEKLTLDGLDGRLECILERPADGLIRGAAVVCHPHPQHGGTMHNKVAHTLARSFLRQGFAALRFNFRGTEGSAGSWDNGIGEVDDVMVAIDYMRGQFTDQPLWLSGFSFGAAMSVMAATRQAVDGLVTVAPAVVRFVEGLDGQPDCPWLVVQGDVDELVAVEETVDWLNGLLPGPQLHVMQDAEHFFHGRLNDLREVVMAFVARHSES